MRPAVLRLGLVALGCAATLAPLKAEAQSVRGVLLDAASGAPIEGAMVLLLDESGQTAFQVLTDARGAFRMDRQVPGRYTLRTDRIGHASTTHPPFTIPETGSVTLELRAAVEAITLEGIEVEGDARCKVRGEEGREIATVWEEVRKALETASWTGEHGVFRYELAHITRDLDRDARMVTDQQVRYERTSRQRTFVSRPAEELIDVGFVVDDEDGRLFFGPDADVLLSSAFLSTHCFRLRSRSDAGRELIGLEFEPLQGRRLPDIAGTLWLDRSTSVLQLLEWRYQNLDPNLDTSHVGGRVEFTALPSGPWIIRKWWIRMPIIGFDRQNQSRRGRALIGIREVGAQVRRISEAAGGVVAEFEGSVVQGFVRGGYEGGRLAGATVRVTGSESAARSDARGRYRLLTPEGGVYGVTFSHPYLDSLGYSVPTTTVELADRQILDVDLHAPSPWEVLEERCGEDELLEGTAAVMGWLKAAHEGGPLPNATIRFDWSGFEVPLEGMILERGQGMQITPDARGFYFVCALPVEVPLRVQLAWSEREGEPRQHETTLEIPADAWRWHFDFTAPVTAAPPDPGRSTAGN